MRSNAVLEYPALVARVQPKVIQSEAMNEDYIRQLEALEARYADLSPAERDLYELLAVLIDEFENRTYPMKPLSPAECLRELMRANDLKQKDLVGIFESPSVVSEVLSGKRELTKEHIRRLSKRFHVSPEVFF